MRSSVKLLQATKMDELLHHTLQLWQPRVVRELSREDARQITENIAGFFLVLAEWSRAETTSSISGAANARRRSS